MNLRELYEVTLRGLVQSVAQYHAKLVTLHAVAKAVFTDD